MVSVQLSFGIAVFADYHKGAMDDDVAGVASVAGVARYVDASLVAENRAYLAYRASFG